MNPTLKGSLISKTVWLGAAVTVMGYIQANIDMISQFIPPKYVEHLTPQRDGDPGLPESLCRGLHSRRMERRGHEHVGAA